MFGRMKPFFYRVAIVSLILYCITVLIYFLYFYKPVELLPDGGYDSIGEINEMFISIHRQNVTLFIVLSLFCCIMVSLIVMYIYVMVTFYYKPIIEINAIVKSKEAVGKAYVDPRSFSYVGYTYSITFEAEDGSEMNFMVIWKTYGTLFEGNKGILKYKHGIVNSFMGFDITSIE